MAMERIDTGVRRIVAPNPSPMTGRGTNTYVLGSGRVAVIDPGPEDAGHLAAIAEGLDPGERIVAILVTHAHLDHSEGAPALSRQTGAPVWAFGDADAGRSAAMSAFQGRLPEGEGTDRAFRPDRLLADGEELGMGDWRVRALHTPGHFGNHLSFGFGDLVFSGDVVMGWSTTLIAPPEGDLNDYFRSLARLRGTGARRLLPGHGAPVEAPTLRIDELDAHRRLRSAQILGALAGGPKDIPTLRAMLYPDLAAPLHPAAERNILAHLIALHAAGEILGAAGTNGPFALPSGA